MVKDSSHSAFGISLPGTAGPTGRESERAKGNVQQLGAGDEVLYEIEVGAVDQARAHAVSTTIQAILQ